VISVAALADRSWSSGFRPVGLVGGALRVGPLTRQNLARPKTPAPPTSRIHH
jgi:hypothetical protein